jgi:tetratricopeptide (TPR) repeat protein
MDQLSAHLDRGWDLAQRGDAAGASACARRALELDPQSPEVHNLLGYTSALAGDADEALEHYRQAIALDETYLEAMLNGAEVLMNPLGEWDEAVQLCDDALEYAETKEEIADCILLRVDALLGKGDDDEARRSMVRLPEPPFESGSYTFLIGRAYYELAEGEKALPFIEESVRLEPEHADAQYYLGLLRDDAGDSRGAIEAFLRSRALDASRLAAPWAPSSDAFVQVVKRALSGLDALLGRYVRDAEVYIVDVPGAELVVDGVDPRALVVLDTRPQEDEDGVAARLFVYQRNVERAAGTAANLEAELASALEREITAAFLDREPPSTADKSQLN